MKHRISFARIHTALLVLGFALLPQSAFAAFHFMEIEQVIGGVGGDTAAQAVQIKMRFAGQQFVANNAALVVRDAAGANPVVLSTFPGLNPTGGACREILLATAGFAAKTTPVATGFYTMNAIPASYLPAGSLTFESAIGGQVWWRTSWGGAAYSNTVPANAVTSIGAGGNDDDGTAAPAFAGPLPSGGATALRFTPACAAASTTNAAQYAVTAGPAVFTNNALASFTVNSAPVVPGVPALPGVSKLLLPAALGIAVLAFALLRRRRTA